MKLILTPHRVRTLTPRLYCTS